MRPGPPTPPLAYQGFWAPPRPPASGWVPVSPWSHDRPSWLLCQTTSGSRDAGPWVRPLARSPRPTCWCRSSDSVGPVLGVAESGVSVPSPPHRPARSGDASASLSTATLRGGRARGKGATAERTRGRQGAPLRQRGAGAGPGRDAPTRWREVASSVPVKGGGPGRGRRGGGPGAIQSPRKLNPGKWGPRPAY